MCPQSKTSPVHCWVFLIKFHFYYRVIFYPINTNQSENDGFTFKIHYEDGVVVALIVRMDDAGFFLVKKSGNKGFLATLGQFLIQALPVVIKALAVIGTVALLLVSGGIFLHKIEYLHHLVPKAIPSMVAELLAGIVFGSAAVLFVEAFKKLKAKVK